jgi:hypothetical protein
LAGHGCPMVNFFVVDPGQNIEAQATLPSISVKFESPGLYLRERYFFIQKYYIHQDYSKFDDIYLTHCTPFIVKFHTQNSVHQCS